MDGATNNLLTAIPVTTSGAASVFVDPVRNLAYVASSPVTLIDPAAGTVVTTNPTTGASKETL